MDLNPDRDLLLVIRKDFRLGEFGQSEFYRWLLLLCYGAPVNV
jgi:hypothetical protein